MIDRDLADLYGVTTKRLNQQVQRNKSRFPADFTFRLTAAEKAQVVAKCNHLGSLKFSPKAPLAFTEHGAIMLASVLKSAQAVTVSVTVVRAFVHLRQLLAGNQELAERLTELERAVASHDKAVLRLFASIRALTEAPPGKSRPIGFTADVR